jgi:serine/threonine protein kinase/nicotinamidase-related amidase
MEEILFAQDVIYQQLQGDIDHTPCHLWERLIVQNKKTQEEYWMVKISFTNEQCHQHAQEIYREISFESLEEDVKILKRISHQSIVSLFEAYRVRQIHECHLIFPFLPHCQSFKILIQEIPSPPLSDQLKWMKQTLSALDYLHQNIGVRHGKLTPENILITSTKNVKLINLEIPSLHEIPQFYYLSYERLANLEFDGRDDIWAFGLIFAELLLELVEHRDPLLNDPLGLNQQQQQQLQQQESEEMRELLVMSCMEISSPLGSIIEFALRTPQTQRPTAATLSQFINAMAPASLPNKAPATSLSSSSPPLSPSPLSCLPQFGAGDVFIAKNFLDKQSLADLMTHLQQEIQWFQLKHLVHNTCFPRLTSFQALIDDSDSDGTLPIYRCADPQPWDNQYSTISFTPLIKKLKERIEEVTGETYNWCRMLQYREDKEDDGMGFHSDKYLDIATGSNIVSFSIGQSRDYLLRLKKGVEINEAIRLNPLSSSSSSSSATKIQKISLSHNTLLLLGPQTNMHYLHAIAKERQGHSGASRRKSKASQASGVSEEEENGLFDCRISITFRKIATFYCPLYRGIDQCCFYGQGVPLLETKEQMVWEFYRKTMTRHLGTGLGALVGYLSSISVGIIWRTGTSLTNSSDRSKSLRLLVTTLCGVLTRLYLVTRAKAASQAKRRRFISVYRLLNLFPIDPPEAVRLLEQASQIEIDSLLQTQTQTQTQSDKYSEKFLKQQSEKRNPTVTQSNDRNTNMSPANSIVSSYDHSREGAAGRAAGRGRGGLRGDHRGGTGAGAGEVKGSRKISVCLMIDVLNDFMLPSGAFCQVYGLQDTHRIRHTHPTLIEIYRYCHEHRIQVILVTSVYQEKQFKKIPTLCTTEEGRQFSLPLFSVPSPTATSPALSLGDVPPPTVSPAAVSDSSLSQPLNQPCQSQSQGESERQGGKADMIHVKTRNSLLSCSVESKELLLQTLRHQEILICGVTTVCCVRHAVTDILSISPSLGCHLHLSRDSVASRDACFQQEQDLLSQWQREDSEGRDKERKWQEIGKGKGKRVREKSEVRVHVHDSWREVFNS